MQARNTGEIYSNVKIYMYVNASQTRNLSVTLSLVVR